MLRFELPAGVCWPRIEAGKAQRLRSTRSEDFSAADAQTLLQLAALAAAHVHAAPAAVASLAWVSLLQFQSYLLYFAFLCFTLFYFALLCFTLFYFVLLCFTLFYFFFTLFYFVLLCFTCLSFDHICFSPLLPLLIFTAAKPTLG